MYIHKTWQNIVCTISHMILNIYDSLFPTYIYNWFSHGHSVVHDKQNAELRNITLNPNFHYIKPLLSSLRKHLFRKTRIYFNFFSPIKLYISSCLLSYDLCHYLYHPQFYASPALVKTQYLSQINL